MAPAIAAPVAVFASQTSMRSIRSEDAGNDARRHARYTYTMPCRVLGLVSSITSSVMECNTMLWSMYMLIERAGRL